MKAILLLLMIVGSAAVPAQTLVKDINPTGGSTPTGYVRIDSIVYFIANDGTHGDELWRTDGTDAGTYMVKDINPLSSSLSGFTTDIFYANLVVLNNAVYFGAYDSANHAALWKSDGTEAGTVIVKDIDPTGGGINLTTLRAVGNTLYFAGGFMDIELWKSDGTENGTSLVKSINSFGSSNPRGFFLYNGSTYFTADDGVNGTELWRTDGTTLGTSMVKDIDPAGGSWFDEPFIFNGTLYFRSYTTASGVELYKTDGTAAGTVMVKDIATASLAYPSHFAVLNNRFYFSANDDVNGIQLWSSDGTEAGTSMLKKISPNGGANISYMTVYNNALYFAANDSARGTELWVSDGTAAGTTLFLDINNVGTQSSGPNSLTVAGGKLYFAANDGTNGLELWQSDGTVAGTSIIDICPSACASNPGGLFAAPGRLYFGAYDPVAMYELYKMDIAVTGIKETTAGINFRLYPNPAYDRLSIEIAGDGIVKVFDLQGRLHKQQNIVYGQADIDVASLTPGMYVLQVTDQQGNTGLRKIVKE